MSILQRTFGAMALLCLTAGAVSGQEAPANASGRIYGTVLVDGVADPIDAVVVTVEGEGRESYSRTNASGAFELELSPGVYAITFTKTGFEERTFKDIEVGAAAERRVDVRLVKRRLQSAGGPEQILVTGRYTESAVDESRFSDSVLDVLSADDFAVTGDSDVAGALARVTGVTIVDDKFVYVRGLGERYSSTLFNNALLPSPDPARRVVPLDLFPTGVMEQLSIQKTYSPILPGDFSGGSLQLFTKDIPAERDASLSVGIGINTETTFHEARWYDGDSYDWTGFEGGYRDFPGIVNDFTGSDGRLLSPALLSDEALRDVGRAFNRDYSEENIDVLPETKLNLSYGNSYETPGGATLGFLFGGRYDNDWSHTKEDRRTSKLRIVSQDPIELEHVVSDDFKQIETVNEISYSALATGEVNLDEEQILHATVFFTRLTDKRYIQDNGFLDENDRFVEGTTYEYEERQLWSVQLAGEHFIERLADMRLDWGITFAQTTRDKPDTRFYQYDATEEDDLFTFAAVPAGNSRQWESLQDDAWDFYLNSEFPVSIGENILSTLTVGAKYFDKHRDSDLRLFRFTQRFSDFSSINRSPDPSEIFADENIGRGMWEIGEVTISTDAYTADEHILGVFAQADNEIGANWRLMFGVRFEDSEQTTQTEDPQRGGAITDTLEDSFFLPAASLTWRFHPDMQLRAAISQTINRPDIRELSRASYLDAEDRVTVTGNPNLDIAQITNYDLRWEWYYGGLDSLQLALFYKDFTDPIEEELRGQGAGSDRRTYTNSESAEVYGLEIAVRYSSENRIHDWLSDAPAIGSFFELWSSSWARDIYTKTNAAILRSTVEADPTNINQTNTSRSLQGQSDWVINQQVTYDNQPIGLQATLTFNMFGERIDAVGTGGLDDSYEQPVPLLDFNLRQRFEWFEQNMLFNFKVSNILDPDYEITRAEVTERSYKEGRTFDLSLEIEF